MNFKRLVVNVFPPKKINLAYLNVFIYSNFIHSFQFIPLNCAERLYFAITPFDKIVTLLSLSAFHACSFFLLLPFYKLKGIFVKCMWRGEKNCCQRQCTARKSSNPSHVSVKLLEMLLPIHTHISFISSSHNCCRI